jgi:probable HAF family extracellular repeat protein
MKHKIVGLIAFLTAFALLLFAGCGGGGGNGTSRTVLTGNAAHRAAILAGYQSFGAGNAYPLSALKMAAPAGGALAGKTRSASALSLFRFAAAAGSRSGQTRAAPLTFVPALNLYSDGGVFNNNTIVLSFFTDAAGTQPAGGFTITLPAGSTDYVTYPSQVTIAINITGGNLPCNGNIVVDFKDKSGANAMTGTLTLPKNNITFHIDLTLDASFNVAGSITGQENGATISLTNCRGNLFDTLTCDLSVAPYGWKGTATGSFVTGVFTTTVDTSSGISSSSVNSSGILSITYPDSTKETVTNPLVAPLVAPVGSGTGGTPPSGTPIVALSAIEILPLSGDNASSAVGINNTGQVAGNSAPEISSVGSDDHGFVTVNGVSTPIPPLPGDSTTMALSINAGNVLGYSGRQGTLTRPYVYSNGMTNPITVPTKDICTFVGGVNAAGSVSGTDYCTGHDTPFVYSNGTASSFPLPTGDIVGFPAAINAKGQVTGNSQVGQNSPRHGFLYSPSTGVSSLIPILSGDINDLPMAMNDAGQVVGYSYGAGSVFHAFVYDSATGSLTAIAPLPGDTASLAYGINSQGQVVGNSAKGSTLRGFLYQSTGTVDVQTLLPTSFTSVWTITNVHGINDSGQIAATAVRKADNIQHAFLLTPVTKAAQSALAQPHR